MKLVGSAGRLYNLGRVTEMFFYINYKMIYWILCKKFVIFLYKFLGSQIVVFLIPKFRDYRNLHQNNYEHYMYRFSYLLCLQPSKVFWWEQWWEFKQRIPKFRDQFVFSNLLKILYFFIVITIEKNILGSRVIN